MRCKEQVTPAHSYRSRSCSRQAARDGYCNQHHPDAKADRAMKSAEKYAERYRNSTGGKLHRMREAYMRLKITMESFAEFGADPGTASRLAENAISEAEELRDDA